MVQSMRHLPNILSSLRMVGAVGLLLCDVAVTTLALPSSVTTWPSSSELGWLSLLRPFVSIIPISIVAAVATFAAIHEGCVLARAGSTEGQRHFIRRNAPR